MLRLLVSVLALAGWLAGCGSNSGSPAMAPIDQVVGGYWEGVDDQGASIVVLATDDGVVHYFSDSGAQGTGTATVNSRMVSVEMTLAAPLGSTLSDGSATADCTGTGRVFQRLQFDLTLSCMTDMGGTLDSTIPLEFNHVFDLDGALATVAGQYDASGVVLNIDGNGVMDEQDPSTGCVLNGQIAVVDPRFDIYDIAFTFGNCTGADAKLNGVDFTGLAAYDDTQTPNVLFGGLTGVVDGVLTAAAVSVPRI